MTSYNLIADISGKATIEGETDFSGINIQFIPFSITAKDSSTVTDVNGEFSIKLPGGIYQILYSKDGFQSVYYNKGTKVALSENESLNPVFLNTGSVVYFSGDVSGTCSPDSLYIVTDDIILPVGKTLTILPGTKIKFDSSYKFTIEGKLLAIGSDSNRITFTSNLSIPKKGDWGGLIVKNSNTIIDNCIIEYCKTGINCSVVGPTIINNKIRSFVQTGIFCDAGSATIINNEIYDFNSTSSRWGIWIGTLSNAPVECNYIHDGASGISVGSSISVKNNKIFKIRTVEKEGYGLKITYGSAPDIINNYINDCNISVYILESKPLIVNNTLVNSDAGILYSNNFDGTIKP